MVKENFKGNASKKDLRDVKLDPLLDSLKTQNIGISSSTSLKLKLNVHRSLKVAEIETIFKGSKLGKQVKNQNLCSESQEILIAAPKKKINKGLSQSIEFRKERPLEKKKIIKEIDGLWKLIVANLKKNRKISILDNVHWTLYRVWRVIMRNGLRKIQKSWKKTRTSAIKIQKNFKMHLARKNFGKKLLASKLIQHYWKHTWGARKSYLRTKRLISFVQVYAR